MTVTIEKIDYISPEIREGTVTFLLDGKAYQAFTCFSDIRQGQIMEVHFTHLEGETTWEERFGLNKEKKKTLISTGLWSYDGYGQIISIDPVKADFGPIVLELGHWTHDAKVMGEFIFWRVGRLDIYRA